MALAIEAARTAVEACEAGGFYIGASVIDTSGQPRAMVESDGSDGGQSAGRFEIQNAQLRSTRRSAEERRAAITGYSTNVRNGGGSSDLRGS